MRRASRAGAVTAAVWVALAVVACGGSPSSQPAGQTLPPGFDAVAVKGNIEQVCQALATRPAFCTYLGDRTQAVADGLTLVITSNLSGGDLEKAAQMCDDLMGWDAIKGTPFEAVRVLDTAQKPIASCGLPISE